MQRLTNQSVTGTRSVSRLHKVALALLWLIIAMMIAAAPGRSEPAQVNGQMAKSHLVAQISASLSTYASRVEALAQDDERAGWTVADVAAAGAYRHLVWYLSSLQMKASIAEAQEFAAIQEMVDVYRDLHERMVVSAKAGDRTAVRYAAQVGSGVVAEIQAALHRLESRGYDAMHATISRVAALN